jgi:Uma2 family endonuclease
MGAAEQSLPRLSIEEFFEWQKTQESRFELVDGIPIEMMAGASRSHDQIAVNIIASLHGQLRDSPCQPCTADTAVRTSIRSLRRADVLVTCDPPKLDVYEALEPRLVVEVISPSNTGVRWMRKLNEYRRHQRLDYILLIDSQVVAATLFIRTETGWDEVEADTFSDVFQFPAIGCQLSMEDMYRRTGLEPDAAPDAPTAAKKPPPRRRKPG